MPFAYIHEGNAEYLLRASENKGVHFLLSTLKGFFPIQVHRFCFLSINVTRVSGSQVKNPQEQILVKGLPKEVQVELIRGCRSNQGVATRRNPGAEVRGGEIVFPGSRRLGAMGRRPSRQELQGKPTTVRELAPKQQKNLGRKGHSPPFLSSACVFYWPNSIKAQLPQSLGESFYESQAPGGPGGHRRVGNRVVWEET